MNQKFDVCARVEIEGKDKPIWPKVGMTVTRRADGKMTLFDARTGKNYFLFERTQNNQQAPQQQQPQQQKPSNFDDFDDDIPF